MLFGIEFDMLLISRIFLSLCYYVLVYLVRYVTILKDLSFNFFTISLGIYFVMLLISRIFRSVGYYVFGSYFGCLLFCRTFLSVCYYVI